MFENSVRKKIPVVLIVEFRDEVYASLRAVLRQEGMVVERARFEATVPAGINRLRPDLILIHAAMPYESGWLIACKLTFSHPGQAVWLYGAQNTAQVALRQRVCGVETFIACGGALPQLAEEVRQALRSRWGANPPRSATPAAPRERAGAGARRSRAWIWDLDGIVFPFVN